MVAVARFSGRQTPVTRAPAWVGCQRCALCSPAELLETWPWARALTRVWRDRCVSCLLPAQPPWGSAPPVCEFGRLWSFARKRLEQHGSRSVCLRVWSHVRHQVSRGHTPSETYRDPILAHSGGGHRSALFLSSQMLPSSPECWPGRLSVQLYLGPRSPSVRAPVPP